ncbi:MAG: phosphoribosylanthranilate isomerase [Dehalococcoidia bacterium]|nr:phosphoribosylanthranilate isomerase [Dehalococcoidia bacterium]
MTQVKICGNREMSDVMMAAEAGADFTGLVFVPGTRRTLDEEKAIRMIATLREQVPSPPKMVGIFADQPLKEVDRLVRRCGLDMVQLCGGESLDYCGKIGVPVIKVLHVSDALDVANAVDNLSQELLEVGTGGHLATLDRGVEGLQGGTGQSFNWDIARVLSSRGFQFLLAGGLTPENVGPAVSKVRPWGVDVSSGVETGGAKDVEKVRAFIRAVRGVDDGDP